MDTHVCHNHDGSEHLHHQFPIIDRFILEWLTDADLARTRICMSEDVEEEFLTAMDPIRYEEVRELVILSALHNNVHDLVEIEAWEVPVHWWELVRDPDLIDPPGTYPIASMLLFANQLSGDKMPELYIAVMVIAWMLHEDTWLKELVGEYPKFFTSATMRDGSPALDDPTYQHLRDLVERGWVQ
ncbi:hypothetical protein [Mobiluncus curtisii]|uniref:Uncharacterized protein n=2 Tax=Mobiluncus curtisii TaxID=2051 RepID=D6ZG19_MOBCV|nr:hypothetical protein [Mobiluncus curtisii]ADI67577.1 hypothetical protein HMPREF0573_11258 [Mobiluncus curtisii ATCC 43063]NMW89517.1 hypothetical protein [Mobiluncus curtisii]QQU08714.1 hypothetical protein I6I85_00550 [Mobiluncus curtisii]SQB65104.1 Uncharacterised protein [Mobiluncus curtisii]